MVLYRVCFYVWSFCVRSVFRFSDKMMAFKNDDLENGRDLEQRMQEMALKLDNLSTKISNNERRNSIKSEEIVLRDSVRATQEINTKLMTDVEILKAEVTQLKEKNAILNKTVSSLERDLTSTQAEQLTFRQDFEAALTEMAKVSALVGALQRENAQLRQEVTQLETSMQESRCDLATMQTDLGEKMSRLATDVKRYKESRRPSTVEVQTLESASSLRPEVEGLQQKGSELAKNVAWQRKEVEKLRHEVSSLQGKSGDVLADVSIFRSEAQTLINNFKSQIRDLQTFVAKSSVQVAFHACLTRPITTTRMETLVCDNIISNVGAAYDPRTGVFTAPVPGVYAFFVNTSPCQRDQERKARLSVVLENRRIAHVYARGLWWSTGHTALKLDTGHRVWLRTFDDDHYTFSEGWTSFTGMLIQSHV